MEKSVQITLIIVAAVIVIGLIGYGIFYQTSGPKINANGIATVYAMPDIVSAYFTIETKAGTAQEAKDENSEIADNVITALIKTGLERKEITTEYFNVAPNYEWDGIISKQKGYIATHSLRIRLNAEQIDKIGSIIDAGVDNGANINYINFELSQEAQNKAKAEALEKATLDAKAKAEGIAAGLGKELGRIVSIQTSEFDYYPWRLYGAEGAMGIAEEAKAAVTDISPGEREIQGSVTVVFALR